MAQKSLKHILVILTERPFQLDILEKKGHEGLCGH